MKMYKFTEEHKKKLTEYLSGVPWGVANPLLVFISQLEEIKEEIDSDIDNNTIS